MNFEPINIKVRDLKSYADIALAIDSPFFITEANLIRKEYGIINPLRQKDWREWVDLNIIKKKGTKAVADLFSKITDIRARMILTPNYQVVFEKAVFGCDIEDGDYKTTLLINFQKLPEYLYYKLPISEMYAILLTPQSSLDDVQNIYSEYNSIMQTMKKNSVTNDIFDDYIQSKKTKKTNIKMIRRCYWIRYGDVILNNSKKPLSYSRTLKRWREECTFIKEHEENANEYDKCLHCSANSEYNLQKLIPIYTAKLFKG